jgi:hypothetical protein
VDAFPGPKLTITVTEGASFYGEVQCNPRMVLAEPSPAAARQGA